LRWKAEVKKKPCLSFLFEPVTFGLEVKGVIVTKKLVKNSSSHYLVIIFPQSTRLLVLVILPPAEQEVK
jgi:hypothetical protein